MEDMLEKATGENKQLQPSSVEDILKYAQTLAPQVKDTHYRALAQVVNGGADALHPEPIGGFMGTVTTVHQDKPAREVLNKTGVKPNSKDSRRATLVPQFSEQDYTPINQKTKTLADISQNRIYKHRQSDVENLNQFVINLTKRLNDATQYFVTDIDNSDSDIPFPSSATFTSLTCGTLSLLDE